MQEKKSHLLNEVTHRCPSARARWCPAQNDICFVNFCSMHIGGWIWYCNIH